LRLTLDGERIVECEPVIGYMHRGVEKLFEVRDYRQIIVLANRHDWLSAFSSELGVVLAVERMLGMEVPVRAVWARTLLAELNRVLNHLMFLGSYPLEIGAITPIFYAFRERETIQEVMEEVSGGRMHYMFNRVGGLKEDLPAGWLGRVSAVVGAVRNRLPQIEELIFGNEIFRARTVGVGKLAPELVAQYGVSGPIARASGVDFDLRRDDPYLAYADLAASGVLRVATRQDGDCHSRFGLLLDQVKVSLDLADACADQLRSLPQGPINVRLPKILKAPEGYTYCWTENPLGINGYLLVSRGEKTPWRLKLRSASFNNISVLPRLLEGCVVADMVAILGSMFFVVGDIDK
jgi:NADH-quinone oxidoreductase subunit D